MVNAGKDTVDTNKVATKNEDYSLLSSDNLSMLITQLKEENYDKQIGVWRSWKQSATFLGLTGHSQANSSYRQCCRNSNWFSHEYSSFPNFSIEQ